MDRIQNKKVTILSTESDIVDDSVQLLLAHGFEVEVRPPRKREWLLHSDDSITSYNHREKQLVERACKHLLSNIHNKFTLGDVASFVGSNRTQLAAAFKRILGTGVFEWLRNQRLLKARTLLLHSSLSVQEIGFEVGYENQANFASAYKKQFLVSPTQQRQSPGF